VECIRLTEEDMQRGEMYQTQLVRDRYAAGFQSIEDFWNGLELEVKLEAARPLSIPRIAQLTQKTNQMNLTTRRYSEAQIEALIGDSNWRLFSLSARDRFGDHGIVGAMFLNMKADDCHIDTFLLSCRILGFRLEHYMIAFAAAAARQDGKRRLIGEFIPTAKNKIAADMYLNLGFQKVSDSLFSADLDRTAFHSPKHIRPVLEEPPFSF
jgi:FkbH-like protein